MDRSKKEILKDLGASISRHRKRCGLTIEKLAYGVEISKGNLSDIENGKRDPRYTTLKAIAEGLDIPLSALFKEL